MAYPQPIMIPKNSKVIFKIHKIVGRLIIRLNGQIFLDNSNSENLEPFVKLLSVGNNLIEILVMDHGAKNYDVNLELWIEQENQQPFLCSNFRFEDDGQPYNTSLARSINIFVEN